MNDINRYNNFLCEIDKLKSILRRNRTISDARHENSAEHSWHATMLAFVLAEYANVKVDINHVIKMLLIHDIGEIDTGDSSLYTIQSELASSKVLEWAAAQRIFNILPVEKAKELISLWQEFENNETPEAQFANAMDRLAPAMIDLCSYGRGWKADHISKEQVLTKVVPIVKQGATFLGRWLES